MLIIYYTQVYVQMESKVKILYIKGTSQVKEYKLIL